MFFPLLYSRPVKTITKSMSQCSIFIALIILCLAVVKNKSTNATMLVLAPFSSNGSMAVQHLHRLEHPVHYIMSFAPPTVLILLSVHTPAATVAILVTSWLSLVIFFATSTMSSLHVLSLSTHSFLESERDTILSLN